MSRVCASIVLVLIAGTSALAADLPVYKAPVAPPSPAFSWTGFYIGANLGYGWGHASTDLTQTTFSTSTLAGLGQSLTNTALLTEFGNDKTRLNGALGGFQAGHNWQYDRFVVGLEGDIEATGQRGGVTICPVLAGPPRRPCPSFVSNELGTANYQLPWFATLRGRVGVTFDRVLLYATAGVAVSDVRANYADGFAGAISPLASGSMSATRTGWALGGGIEGAIDRNWSIKAEYLHMDFGSVDQSVTDGNSSIGVFPSGAIFTTVLILVGSFHTRVTDDVFRVGVNYRFGGPVVAKY